MYEVVLIMKHGTKSLNITKHLLAFEIREPNAYTGYSKDLAVSYSYLNISSVTAP